MLGDQPEVNAILVLHRVVDLVDARAQRGDLLRAVVPRVRGREPRDLSAVRLLGQLDRQEGWVDTAFQSDFRRLDLGCIEADVCKLVNTHVVAFFKIYNICRRLHRSKLFFAKWHPLFFADVHFKNVVVCDFSLNVDDIYRCFTIFERGFKELSKLPLQMVKKCSKKC